MEDSVDIISVVLVVAAIMCLRLLHLALTVFHNG